VRAAAAEPAVDRIRNPRLNLGNDCGYRQLMSDIFHDLSQPLSTLTCLLEINLLLRRSAKQWRHDLKIALQQLRSIVAHIRALRELWEAGSEQQDQQVLSLDVCLRNAVADLLPVAESAKVKIKVFFASSSDCRVNFQATRLQQALVYLLEFALESSAADSEVEVMAEERDEMGRVRVVLPIALSESCTAGAKAQPDSKARELKRRVGVAVAWRIFETAGGTLQMQGSGERVCLEARLPLASSSK